MGIQCYLGLEVHRHRGPAEWACITLIILIIIMIHHYILYVMHT